MKVGDLIDLLMTYRNDEIEIETYEATSGKFIDSSNNVTILEENSLDPTLRADVENGKFQKLLK